MPKDYVSEADLLNYGITLDEVRTHCPWATELIALDGSRCWDVVDLHRLLEGNSR